MVRSGRARLMLAALGLALPMGMVACGSGDVRLVSVGRGSSGAAGTLAGGTDGSSSASAGSDHGTAGARSGTAGGDTAPGGHGGTGDAAQAGQGVVGGEGSEPHGAAGSAGTLATGSGGSAGAVDSPPAQAGTAGSPPAETGGSAGSGVAGGAGGTGGAGGSAAAGAPVTGGESGIGGSAGGAGATGGGMAGAAGTAPEPTCLSPQDCPPGEICGAYRDGNFYCTEPAASGAALGESCEGAMLNDACADRICLDFSGQCSRLCVEDSDCSSDGSTVCAAFDVRAYCVQACASDADCAAGQVCSLIPNEGEDRFDWVCSNPRGTVATGETPEGGDCSTGGDCEKALCLTYTSGDVTSYYCTGTCQSEADCPASLPVCGTLTLSLLGGDQQQTPGCLPE